jgi:hypothetical protein
MAVAGDDGDDAVLFVGENSGAGPRLWRCALPCGAADFAMVDGVLSDDDAAVAAVIAVVDEAAVVVVSDGAPAGVRVVDAGGRPGARADLDVDVVDGAVVDDGDLYVVGSAGGPLRLQVLPGIFER